MGTEKKDFHHPYQPYDIQYEMMDALYNCIANGQVGIFESPTGTGKSLSLICSSLTWLRDFQDGTLNELLQSEHDGDEPDWVMEHSKIEKRNTIVEHRQKIEERLHDIRVKELHQQQQFEWGQHQPKRLKTDRQEARPIDDAEAQFVLDDYQSDSESLPQEKMPSSAGNHGGLSAASVHLMEKLGLLAKSDLEDLQPEDETKIFYCSRTHSQLAQFVHELRRVKLRSALWSRDTNKLKDFDETSIKHLPLGSRKNLCINSKVSKLVNPIAINERCLELQQQGVPEEHKCPFLPTKENEHVINNFRDHTLAQVRDIEDLGSLGKKLGICPYYATRATIKPSEIITLPYPLLLQKSAREALDISLKGHVIIIDEAHNLMDAITNIHSVVVTQSQLKSCRAQLRIYLHKFRNRLKGKNRVYVAQVVRLLDSISAYLEGITTTSSTLDGVIHISDLLSGKGVDQINIYKLIRYLKESRLARKVEGYAAYIDKNEVISSLKLQSPSIPVLTHIESLLEALVNPSSEGRLFYEKEENHEMSVKYMLLDPSKHFKSIIEESRAVILAGGTMSPMNDYFRQIFPYVNPSNVKMWSCGHVIPKNNLTVWPVAKGPENVHFEFTYSKRNSEAMVDALGSSLVNFAATIPDGVVVFFPSYAYLDQVVSRWEKKKTGDALSIWSLLSLQKPVFRETKDTWKADDVFQEYTQAINSNRGALLLSVIGGKMSEGINFSDRLGRGVIVVGLPFPNIQSAQWKAKLEYIGKCTVDRGGTREEGKAAGREFSENACMRAVNQSIGRAIRHQHDFACIILLDQRYQTPRIADKLPGWIKQGIVQRKGEERFNSVLDGLATFFSSKKKA